MKNSQSVENNLKATERAVEFMKVYGLALLFLMAVSVLVNVHPAFSGEKPSEFQAKEKTESGAGPVAQAASEQLGKRILDIKWVLF